MGSHQEAQARLAAADLYLRQERAGALLAADRAALLRAADRLVARLSERLSGPPDLLADLAALRLLAGLDPQAVPPLVAGQPEADQAALYRAVDQHLSVVLPALRFDRRAVLADRVARCLAEG